MSALNNLGNLIADLSKTAELFQVEKIALIDYESDYESILQPQCLPWVMGDTSDWISTVRSKDEQGRRHLNEEPERPSAL